MRSGRLDDESAEDALDAFLFLGVVMPYIVIGGEPVFLPLSRRNALEREALKGKEPLYKLTSRFAGSRENLEVKGFIVTFLEAQYKADPSTFHREWVEFDLVGDEAQENAWDLLYDYCHLHGYAKLTDIRSRDPGREDWEDVSGEAYYYPMGRVFALDHPLAPASWWWRYTHRMRGRLVRIIIDSRLVERLAGSLDSFSISTHGYQIRCGRHFEVLPAVEGVLRTVADMGPCGHPDWTLRHLQVARRRLRAAPR